MISKPTTREDRKSKVVGQRGNSLAYGPNSLYLPLNDLMSHVLAPMKKSNATTLQILFDPNPLVKDTCPLPAELNVDTFFHKTK